jgi:IS5 family transposase
MPLAPSFGEHLQARELAKVSEIFDANPRLYELVHQDLINGKSPAAGRKGLSGEQVLRIGFLYQRFELTYDELSFHLQDSQAFRAFARISLGAEIKPKRLQGNLKRIRPETWEAINRVLVLYAQEQGVEQGRKIRTDCTGVEANIHAPTDSSLLWDCVRVVTRVLHRLEEHFPGVDWAFQDHTRRAKKRFKQIEFSRKRNDKKALYQDLLRAAQLTYGYGTRALELVKQVPAMTSVAMAMLMTAEEELRAFLTSMQKVMDQTRRRVIEEQSVPADEKLLSIFETHTDIIVKGSRDPLFGHKICLTAGASSLILDCVIEDGNPADSTLVERTFERQIEIFGRAPRQASFDGGFASKDNLKAGKDKYKVEDVVFHKKRGLEETEMARSLWVFKRLRNFRAGIEGIISCLKRAVGLTRVVWRGLQGFKSYVWSSVVSFNALTLARRLLARAAPAPT